MISSIQRLALQSSHIAYTQIRLVIVQLHQKYSQLPFSRADPSSMVSRRLRAVCGAGLRRLMPSSTSPLPVLPPS